MELKFECAKCGQHISAIPEQIGVTAPCPGCGTPVTVPSPVPIQTRYVAKHHRLKKFLKFSGIGCISLVLILIVFIVVGALISSHEQSRRREATIQAWHAMQQADRDVSRLLSSPQEFSAQGAFLYSQIPLTDVDPILVDHLKESIGIYRWGNDLFRRLFNERAKLDQSARDAGQFVEQLSGLANTQQQAAAVNIFGRVLIESAANDEAEKFKKQYVKEGAELDAEWEANVRKKRDVAEKLTAKYGVTFLNGL